MATFNIEFWQKLKEDFLDGKVYFGEAPEDTHNPFAVCHVIDSGRDADYDTLCEKGNIGKADIQINLYASNDMLIDELLETANNLIYSYQNLTTYRIIITDRLRTKNAASFTGEVGMGITEFEFTYEKM